MKTGPFGLACGMQTNELDCKLEELAPYKYSLSAVPKPHSAFDMYVAMITPGYGISWIKSVGKDIVTNPYGVEVISNFESMKSKLGSTYGKSETLDFLMHDSIWNEPRDYMEALHRKERILMSVWKQENGSTMKDSLVSVALIAAAADANTGYIAIEYEFENHTAAEAAISAIEDDAL